jgi:pimeloyl-ACP methyl ester carboxylesterase
MSLYGASYGATLGLKALRGTPGWLESAVLDGVSDPLRDEYAEETAKFQRSLEALDQACSERAECLAAHGHLRANIDTVLRDLESAPKEVTFADFYTGAPRTETVTAEDVAEGLYQLWYVSGALPWLPLAFAEAAAGSYDRLLAVGYAVLDGDSGPNTRSEGMRWSVLCSEEMAYSSRLAFRAYAAGTDRVVSKYLLAGNLQRFDICNVWNVPRAPLELQLPVVSATKTLLISGRFDHVTPPSRATSVSHFLLRDQHVEVMSAAHSGNPECTSSLMTDFFADPTQHLAESCATEPIRFVYRVPGGFQLR